MNGLRFKSPILFILYCSVFQTILFAQSGETTFTGVVPASLLQPDHIGQVVYSLDAVIGELGQGEASSASFQYARSVLNDLIMKAAKSARLSVLNSAELEKIMGKVDEIKPVKYRIGGGREENDGSTSFLFRLIGREKELAGEIYVIYEDTKWKTDDILTYEPKELTKISADENFVRTPYERFY